MCRRIIGKTFSLLGECILVVLFLRFEGNFVKKIMVSEMHLYLDYGATLEKTWRREMTTIVRNSVF